MASDLTEEVLAIFREEALELLRRALAEMNRAQGSQGEARRKAMIELSRHLHTLKGAAAAVGHEELHRGAHALEDRVAELGEHSDARAFDPLFSELEAMDGLLTPQTPARAAPESPSASVQEAGKVSVAENTNVARPAPSAGRPAPAEVFAAARPQQPSFAEWLRIPPERIDQLQAQLGELMLSRLQQDQLVERLVSLRGAASLAMTRQREFNRMLMELRAELSPETFRRLRISTQSLLQGWSHFHDGLQTVCRDARVLQAQSGVVSQAVEESITDLRLMPLAPFLEGFARSARDAARKEKKLVRFTVHADGAEVDRSVLSRLHECLLHLVRNAVVHGIEAPHDRKAQGKPAEGQLSLEATAQGAYALIRITDDGRGIDAEGARQKARDLGLEDQGDLLDLLTHPGLSTRDSVDDLAGRGVGLDVVASIVRSLDGTLSLQSDAGRGSVFDIQVPITASTTMGLVLAVASQRFGVMLNAVERVIRPHPSDIEIVQGLSTVRVGDEQVPVMALADLLGIEDPEPLQERIPVVVLVHGRKRLALAVSEIPGEHALVVRPFGRAFRGAELFIGGAVQPNHSVIPVLSTPQLFARAARTPRGPLHGPLVAPRPVVETQSLRALVVDDSITMRTMLRNILAAAGYRVTVAEDGRAALELLSSDSDYQLIVTDLQMPRMDGIDLCRNVRTLEGPYVPIIMVTSVDDDEEKSRALTAGADAYVVKGSFEQAAFLHRVDTLVHGPRAAGGGA
jgi:chemotaxis protein histidine kinase CheA/CheY-like chemotaxis protein